MAKALLFDVGDVVMEHNWRLLELLGNQLGRDLGSKGPFDPDSDPQWVRCENGEISNDEYWDQAAKNAGYEDRISLWRAMSAVLDGDVFAKDALELVDEARAAGISVGVLSNDLIRSSGRPWVDSRPEFARFDMIVDCTEFGERKPAPAPYLHAAEQLGCDPSDIVFLDDMQYCIDGAHAVGMIGVLVNPLNRKVAFDEARRLVGLPVHA
jgi:putative hydrolase of the HAD superfamily